MNEGNVLLGKPLVVACDYRGLEAKNAIIGYLIGLGYNDIFQEFGIKERLAIKIREAVKDAQTKGQTGYEQFSNHVLGKNEEVPNRKVMLERIIEFAGSDVGVDELMQDNYVFYDLGTYLPVEVDRMNAIDAAKLALTFTAGEFPVILSCKNGQVMNAAAANRGFIPIFGYSYKQAEEGRDHNNSKVLVIPGYIEYIPGETKIGGKLTTEIIDKFLQTPYNKDNDPQRDIRLKEWDDFCGRGSH